MNNASAGEHVESTHTDIADSNPALRALLSYLLSMQPNGSIVIPRAVIVEESRFERIVEVVAQHDGSYLIESKRVQA